MTDSPFTKYLGLDKGNMPDLTFLTDFFKKREKEPYAGGTTLRERWKQEKDERMELGEGSNIVKNIQELSTKIDDTSVNWFEKGAGKFLGKEGTELLGGQSGVQNVTGMITGKIKSMVDDDKAHTYTGREMGADALALGTNIATGNVMGAVESGFNLLTGKFKANRAKDDLRDEMEDQFSDVISSKQEMDSLNTQVSLAESTALAQEQSRQKAIEKGFVTSKLGARLKHGGRTDNVLPFLSSEYMKYGGNLNQEGVSVGPSHDEGGIPGTVLDKGGNARGQVEFEGGEMIFSKIDSEKISDLKKKGDNEKLGNYISKAMDNWPGGWDVGSAKYGKKLKDY